jgi:hypothetical protein
LTIVLRISYKDTDKPEKAMWIGQQTFKEYWLPVCDEFGLEWLAYVYNWGMPILSHLDVLPVLISELQTLRAHFVVDENTSSLTWLIEMADNTLSLLEEIQANPNGFSNAFFG